MTTELPGESLHPKLLLERELARRCARNSQYSLRAFGKALGISHTVLSLVMSGRRPLSRKATAKVAQALGLGPDESAELVRNRLLAPAECRPYGGADTPGVLKTQQLTFDRFAVIADWYHYAILSLLGTTSPNLEPKALARRLGISAVEARLALERLQRVGLIARSGAKWKLVGGAIRIDDSSSTAASRRFHRQLLEKALQSLENDAAETRDFSSMTVALDPRLLAAAADQIQKFRRQFGREFEGKGQPDEVYNLTIQLCPATQKNPISQKRSDP